MINISGFHLVMNKQRLVTLFLGVFMLLTACPHFDSVMNVWWDNCVKPHLSSGSISGLLKWDLWVFIRVYYVAS